MGNEAFCLEEKAMTPSAEKIQRWEVFDGGVNACWVGETTDGPYVLHSDHLAALKRAKAEAGERVKRELRELAKRMCILCHENTAHSLDIDCCWSAAIHARLAEIERGEP
jgi:hypothetical protein